jgi:hypothetical protein
MFEYLLPRERCSTLHLPKRWPSSTCLCIYNALLLLYWWKLCVRKKIAWSFYQEFTCINLKIYISQWKSWTAQVYFLSIDHILGGHIKVPPSWTKWSAGAMDWKTMREFMLRICANTWRQHAKYDIIVCVVHLIITKIVFSLAWIGSLVTTKLREVWIHLILNIISNFAIPSSLCSLWRFWTWPTLNCVLLRIIWGMISTSI